MPFYNPGEINATTPKYDSSKHFNQISLASNDLVGINANAIPQLIDSLNSYLQEISDNINDITTYVNLFMDEKSITLFKKYLDRIKDMCDAYIHSLNVFENKLESVHKNYLKAKETGIGLVSSGVKQFFNNIVSSVDAVKRKIDPNNLDINVKPNYIKENNTDGKNLNQDNAVHSNVEEDSNSKGINTITIDKIRTPYTTMHNSTASSDKKSVRESNNEDINITNSTKKEDSQTIIEIPDENDMDYIIGGRAWNNK